MKTLIAVIASCIFALNAAAEETKASLKSAYTQTLGRTAPAASLSLKNPEMTNFEKNALGVAIVGASFLAVSNLRADWSLANRDEPAIGGYIMGTMYLVGPVFASSLKADQSDAEKFVHTSGLLAMSAYNFFFLTDRDTQPDEIFLGNAIGLAVITAARYGTRYFFPKNSQDDDMKEANASSTLIFPGFKMSEDHRPLGLLMFAADF